MRASRLVWLTTFTLLSVTVSAILLVCAELDVLPWQAAVVGRLFLIAGAVLAVPTVLTLRSERARRPIPRERVAEPVRFSELQLVDDAPLTHLNDTREVVLGLCAAPNVDAIALVKALLSSGFSIGASDLHLTPQRGGLVVQYRVDGVLHDVAQIDARHTSFVINRIKVMANLLMHVKMMPQDGRIPFDRATYQARVSTLPTSHGEKVVIRLAHKEPSRYRLDAIGFEDDTMTLFKTLLLRDHGVICLTGPTGSGKTTTMYASMLHVRESLGTKVNVCTLEDPIEMDFEGISQTEVNAATGLTFAAGLRSVLRQDPNVIMVGEIRDEETAQTAFRAGLTGHLLLTSVHADSTVGVFQRLRQLHVEPFQLAAASIAVVNQRLAIRNCPSCTEEAPISDLQRKQLELLRIDPTGTFYAGKGCELCGGKGRRGRAPLVELLAMDDRLRDMLVNGAPSHKLLETAVEAGMQTLGMQAMARAKEGVLPVDEIIRVLAI